MPWVEGANVLNVLFLDDRSEFPFMTTAPLSWQDPETGEIHTVPKYFRTDGASIPIALAVLPIIGAELVMRYFGHGVFLGFKQGVLHDYLRRRPAVLDAAGNIVAHSEPPVPAQVAHEIFRKALQEAGYPSDLVENYYAAVKAFNSD